MPLAEITSGAVRTYMTKRVSGDGVRPGTVNRELSLLKSILYAAEFDNIIPSNPIRGRRVKRLQEDNSRKQHILEMHITAQTTISENLLTPAVSGSELSCGWRWS